MTLGVGWLDMVVIGLAAIEQSGSLVGVNVLWTDGFDDQNL